MSKNDGGTAFPGFAYTEGYGAKQFDRDGTAQVYVSGMSMRAYFAGQVMGSMLIDTESYPHAARLAFEYADAMIAELAKP